MRRNRNVVIQLTCTVCDSRETTYKVELLRWLRGRSEHVLVAGEYCRRAEVVDVWLFTVGVYIMYSGEGGAPEGGRECQQRQQAVY
jgi:hypothetical protein